MEIISLFGTPQKGRLIEIPITDIDTNPNQPRKYFSPNAINELAESVKQHGLIQPITVRKGHRSKYELVAGERRLRACMAAGFKTIDAIVISATNYDSAALALIENLQRENLNYLEEGEAYSNLITDFGLTQEELAQRIGKTQAYIANKLRVLKLSPEIKKMLLEHKLTERHARALLRLETEHLRKNAVETICKRQLNVAQTEKYIDSLVSPEQAKTHKGKSIRIIKDIRIFTNTIKQAVDLMKQSGIDAVSEKNEDEKYIEYVVRIPKTS